MASIFYHCVWLLFVHLITQQVTASEDVGDKYDILMERMDKLEEDDHASKSEITYLKNKISDIEKGFERKRENLLNEVEDLKSKLAAYENVDYDNAGHEMNDIIGTNVRKTLLHRKRSRVGRGLVEDEVAFYATHSRHDVLHLGANQILPFEQVVTNKGYAYSAISGAFTAPVSGTYVFHATIMGGLSHNTTNMHYQAIIDVNGVYYSKMWITFHDQSSQMLVIDLKARDVVTVRNINIDEGFVGQHYSTFSGFLLYENNDSPSNIIG